MQSLKMVKKPRSSAFTYSVILAIIYLLLSLVLPASSTTQNLYHLSSLQYHVLIVLVYIPVALIWLIAFYGYGKMKEYAILVGQTPEGPAYKDVANGMMWLAWGLVLPSIISLILQSITNAQPGFNEAATIITNYISLVWPVVAFSILSSGSRRLMAREKLFISAARTKLLVLVFVTIGTLFCYMSFRNLGLGLRNNDNPYFLPGWLYMITIVLPYLYAWFIGLLAAYEIRVVSKHSTGVLYRKALNDMSLGLAVTVVASIGLQYLHTTITPRSNHLSLGVVLLVVYIILLVIGLGYGMMAWGAKKLKRFEEV